MVFDITHLKKIRKQLDLTQHKFAQKIGISQSMIAKIESGKLDPTYSYIKKIENAINSLTQNKEKEAKDIMIKKIISVKPKDRVINVIKLMNKHSISQLPVLQNGKVIGLVTESIILEKELEKIKDLKVKELMIGEPPIIAENTKISVVSSLLKYYSIVLILKKGKLTGLITKSDLLKNLI